jgi:uncharacterized protein (UPF0297 family)
MRKYTGNKDKDSLEEAINLGLDKEDVDDIYASLVAITQTVDEKGEWGWFEIRDMLHALKGDLTALIPLEIIENVCYNIEEFMLYDFIPSNFSRNWCEIQEEIEQVVGKQALKDSDDDNAMKATIDNTMELKLDNEDVDDILTSLLAITQKIDEKGDRAWLEIKDMLNTLKGDLSALISSEMIKNISYKIEAFMLCDFAPTFFPRDWYEVQREIQTLIGNSISIDSEGFKLTPLKLSREGAIDFELDKEDVDDILASLVTISHTVDTVNDSTWYEIRDMLRALKGDLAALIPQRLIEKVNHKLEKFILCDETPNGFQSQWYAMEKEIESLMTVS